MDKKYELLQNNTIEVSKGGKKITLYRIKALRSFGDVKAGDLGGYVENENNLSHDGGCWIYDHAQVYDEARVHGEAQVCDKAEVWGNARVYGKAQVYDKAEVWGEAIVG